MKNTQQQPESPLAKAMRQGTLGAKSAEEKTKANQVSEEHAETAQTLQPAGDSIHSSRRRLTAYLTPDMYQWTKVRAAQQDREISEIVEEALRQYKTRIQH